MGIAYSSITNCIPGSSPLFTSNSRYLDEERKLALRAVLRACVACQEIQRNLVSEETITKKDKSPVTVGDYTVQALIIHELSTAFPDYPFVAEEDPHTLEAEPEVKSSVLRFVRQYYPDMDEQTLLRTLGKGGNDKASGKRWWTLDPIDGTLGFLRRDQYAIALALMEDNQPVLGILGCPSLPLSMKEPGSPCGCVLIAVKGQGSFMRTPDNEQEIKLSVSAQNDPQMAIFTESFVSHGFAHALNTKIAQTLSVKAEPLRIDSQCKYAMVARGDSDVYLRLSSLDYKECVWDHAAGALIVQEAGGVVCDFRGNPLDYSVGRKLEQNVGIVCSNSALHPKVMEAIASVDVFATK
jgi:HAL2 family 3'(2'),5'-bisphosphate nucleotidase